jgi:hypothetical protein
LIVTEELFFNGMLLHTQHMREDRMKAICLPLAIFAAIILVFLTVDLNAAQQTQILTVVTNFDSTAAGIVTSTPNGIHCPPNCSKAFPQGKQILLQAKPDAYSYLSGWTDACTSTKKNCVVKMTQDMTATAGFALKEPTMELSTETLDFGTVQTGDKVSQTLKIINTGTGDLEVELSGLEGTEFKVAGKPKATIKPGKNHNFMITLKVTEEYTGDAQLETGLDSAAADAEPAAAKIINIKLKVKSNDPKKPSADLDLLASLVPKRAFNFKTATWVHYNLEGPNGGIYWTYTEKADTIPFNLTELSRAIDCEGSPCKGTTTFTVEGAVIDKSKDSKCPRCTIYGGGTNAWTLTGTSDAGQKWLTAYPEKTISDETMSNCCGKIEPMPITQIVDGLFAPAMVNWDHRLEIKWPKRFAVDMPFFTGDRVYSWGISPK